MSSKHPEAIRTEVVLDDPKDMEIDFSKYKSFKVKSQEIKNSLLTGEHREFHKIHPANIVLSKVQNMHSLGGAFEYVDFKDSYILKTTFKQCSFDYAAIINCDFSETEFLNCTFHNVSITNTTFRRVSFVDCKLDHMVIESCKFDECSFINCTTSNKLFDYCLLLGCLFQETDLQVQTIIGNFGLTKQSLTRCHIRDKSAGEKFDFLDIEQLQDYSVSTGLEAFKLEYFCDEKIIQDGAEVFDKTFELDTWVATAKIALTFTNLITLYHEFLVDRYEKGLCAIYPIIRLHTITGYLVDSNSLESTAMTAVYGVHMSLASYVEGYLALVSDSIKSLSNPLILLVNGPLQKDFYLSEMSYFFDHDGLSITKIIKHNSPNELFVSWQSVANAVPIIALFLASRFKLEFKKLSSEVDRLPDDDKLKEVKKNSLMPTERGFELRLGFDEKQSYLYGLKLKSIFPGDMMMELGIQISTRKISSMRKILIKILDSSNSETS